MVLVDSSVLISREVRRVSMKGDSEETFAVCPAIAQELLQGATTRRQQENARALLAEAPFLDSPTPLERFEHAAGLYVACRMRGYTIGGYDCLIAASAIAHDALLLHADQDFEIIARIAPELRQQRV